MRRRGRERERRERESPSVPLERPGRCAGWHVVYPPTPGRSAATCRVAAPLRSALPPQPRRMALELGDEVGGWSEEAQF